MARKKGCLTTASKDNLAIRIKKIIGQLNGIDKMLKDDRYCIDIMQQSSSVHEALRGFGKKIMRYYLEQCATNAILSKNKNKQKEIYDELMDIIYKYAK